MQIDVSDRGNRRQRERDAADDNQRNEDKTRTHYATRAFARSLSSPRAKNIPVSI
jgi:hypothetical protein